MVRRSLVRKTSCASYVRIPVIVITNSDFIVITQSGTNLIAGDDRLGPSPLCLSRLHRDSVETFFA
jgi:hypothetical protein